MKNLLFTMLFLFVSPIAHAIPIADLFGTGLDTNGVALSAGDTDANYTVIETSTNAEVLSNPPGSYIPNDSNSQWIWQQSNGQPTNVTRTFRTTFDLTGLNYNTAQINGAWGADNQGLDILINGVSTGNNLLGVTTANFGQLHDFQISSGFIDGINTLDFIIQDNGSVSGFRAEVSGTIAVPASSSILFLLPGLVIIAGFHSRKRRTMG